jgi:hypothetical protein
MARCYVTSILIQILGYCKKKSSGAVRSGLQAGQGRAAGEITDPPFHGNVMINSNRDNRICRSTIFMEPLFLQSLLH